MPLSLSLSIPILWIMIIMWNGFMRYDTFYANLEMTAGCVLCFLYGEGYHPGVYIFEDIWGGSIDTWSRYIRIRVHPHIYLYLYGN